MRVILDLLTVKFLISYSTRPLQIFGLLGLGMGALGTVICLYLAYVKYFQHQGIADRPLLLLGMLLLLFSVQLLTTGLVAEMHARTYHESQDKPIYVIREVQRVRYRAGAGRAGRVIGGGRVLARAAGLVLALS